MRRCFSICLLLTVAASGCRKGAAEGKGTAAASETGSQPSVAQQVEAPKGAKAPSASPKQPAPQSVIYSCRELAKVLDLGALAAPEGTEFEYKSPAKLSAQVPGTVPEVSAFYQKSLSALGWERVPDSGRQNTDEYQNFQFGKNGFLVSLTFGKFDVSKEKGHRTLTSLEFNGNLDTRALPRPARDKILSASQTVTAYLTESPVNEVTAWVTKTLAEDGWQRFTSFGAAAKKAGPFDTFTFRKQGYAITTCLGEHPLYKKTHLQYMVAALGHDLPTPPGAAKVQFDDVRWKLRCESPGDWKAAAEFYQKAMPAAGYRPLSGEDPRPTYWNLRFGTDAGDVILVQVSSKDRQVTQVSMEGISAAQLAAMKKLEEQRKPAKK